MLRKIVGLIAIAALLLSATAAFAAPALGKRHVVHRWHGYGFLPGPNRSNGSGHAIEDRFTGMAGRGFIEDAGPVAASAHAGHRRRSGTYGTAVDSDSRPQSGP